MPDLAAELASFAADLQADSLPPAALDAVQRDILDTVGCAFAGAVAPGIPEVRDVLAEWGGRPQSTVWGASLELPMAAAAFANGASAHALDYDDTHDEAVLHAGVTVVPAALAAVETRREATGADVVASVAAGIEVACRLGSALPDGPSASGWLLTPLCGVFGAAAAASRALGLDAERTHHALGIAYAQSAGNGQATLDAALTKRLQPGFAAQAGVMAARLAAAGITGARDVFEGERGWFRVYHGSRYDRAAVVTGLGEDFMVEELRFKPYPCCRWTHAAIDGALVLRARGLQAAELERVDVLVSRQALSSTGRVPSGRGGAAGVVEAQFSIPYAVAVALREGRPGLRHFTVDAVVDPDMLALASRVFPSVDPDPRRGERRQISSAGLVATLRDGGRLEVEIDEPAPAEPSALVAKFREACAFAGFAEERAEELAQRLLDVDHELDGSAFVRMLGRSKVGVA